MWPTVIQTEDNGRERIYDLPSRLLKDRIILLAEEINTNTAMSVISQLLFLDSENSSAPITIYIDSPGGSISDGLAIYDVLNKIKAPVATVCTGMAASMAAFLLCSGSKGMRYCLPNSTVMVHQPLGGAQGQATEIEIVARRILKLREKMYTIMAKNTNGKCTYEEMAKACERDNYLEPEEALALGLIDCIVDCPPKAYGGEN